LDISPFSYLIEIVARVIYVYKSAQFRNSVIRIPDERAQFGVFEREVQEFVGHYSCDARRHGY
jgi:hypothetical protein